MSDTDSFMRRLAAIDRAAEVLEGELATLHRTTRVTRRLRERGLSVSQTLALSPGPASQERVVVHLERLSEALHDYRVEIVRQLVEEDGWSLSEVARRMRSSRQVVSRLYHSGEGPRNGTRPRPKIRLHGSPSPAALSA